MSASEQGLADILRLHESSTSAIVNQGVRRNILSHNGTAGHSMRKVEQLAYPLPPGAALVIHSDGLGTHWHPSAYANMWTHQPSIIAAALYRDHSRRRDDVTVVVGLRRTRL